MSHNPNDINCTCCETGRVSDLRFSRCSDCYDAGCDGGPCKLGAAEKED